MFFTNFVFIKSNNEPDGSLRDRKLISAFCNKNFWCLPGTNVSIASANVPGK